MNRARYAPAVALLAGLGCLQISGVSERGSSTGPASGSAGEATGQKLGGSSSGNGGVGATSGTGGCTRSLSTELDCSFHGTYFFGGLGPVDGGLVDLDAGTLVSQEFICNQLAPPFPDSGLSVGVLPDSGLSVGFLPPGSPCRVGEISEPPGGLYAVIILCPVMYPNLQATLRTNADGCDIVVITSWNPDGGR